MGEVLEVVNFIKDHMVENMMTKDEGATKADLNASKTDMAAGFLRIEECLYSIEQELKEIKRRLTILEDAFEKRAIKINKKLKHCGSVLLPSKSASKCSGHSMNRDTWYLHHYPPLTLRPSGS